jgi:glycosyltransferase involved in cell wall biosynthesis
LEELKTIAGAQRRSVVVGLWRAWREQGAGGAVLVGFSGTGKTERVVRPLVSKAHATLGITALYIDVPAHPTQIDQEMLARLIEALREAGVADLAVEAENAPNFVEAARRVLQRGGLLVIDEFQRLLRTGQPLPVDPYAEKLRKLATRAKDGGCLWLVSNRNLDPEWTEPFHTAFLESLSETADAMDIVAEALGTTDAADRLPETRHEEIAQRFGRNPRALRLLGHLLRSYALDELIGPPQAAAEGLSLQDLADSIERSLLMRAREGLSNTATEFLRDLSVLPEPAPMDLLQSMGSHLGAVPALLSELQGRFLVEQRNALRQVHPLVREVELPRLARDPEASGEAHRRAGAWYARKLAQAVASGNDPAITSALGGVRYHFLAAGAQEDLVAALDVARPYVERKFNWAAPSPSTEAERDAQISLLELFLQEPGAPSVEYQLARRLAIRRDGDDLERALKHAGKATEGQDSSVPWVLRLKLAARVLGPNGAVALGPEAIVAVDPRKGLFAVYQVYGAALNHLGQDDESIKVLVEGTSATAGRDGRLLEEAIQFAAAARSPRLLNELAQFAEGMDDLIAPAALARIYIDELNDEWSGAAVRAGVTRRQFPRYIHAALHEAFCFLAAGNTVEAQNALDRFPIPWRFNARESMPWLAALIALRNGDLARGHDLAEIYLAGPVPKEAAAVERALVRDWDTRVATIGEPNTALEFPILPPALSGLPHSVIRPQHGPPVLPQHAPRLQGVSAGPQAETRILAVGTEWASGHGGLSTFNRQLCIALASTNADVTCLAIAPSEREIAEARGFGVHLVPARSNPGEDERQWLSRRPMNLPDDYRPTVVIGHGRVTGPAAARLAEDVFPGAQRLHFIHMAPDEIEWDKFDRDDARQGAVSAAEKAEQRTQIELDLAERATRTVAVGPRLYNRFLRDLGPYNCPPPLRFDPGFDPVSDHRREAPEGPPWKVLLLGRAEDEMLKGLDIAASATGKAAARLRQMSLPGLELVVRGAAPRDADAIRERIRDWAGAHVDVVVRPFTTDAVTLARDLRSSSLLLMPSRSEGFGLVGLEAITAGTPVLVSSRSGLSELIKEKLHPVEYARITVPTTGDAKSANIDIDEWARAIEAVLKDRNAAFRNASDLASQLGMRVTWFEGVSRLLASLKTS